jgi:hypothetical protein
MRRPATQVQADIGLQYLSSINQIFKRMESAAMWRHVEFSNSRPADDRDEQPGIDRTWRQRS